MYARRQADPLALVKYRLLNMYAMSENAQIDSQQPQTDNMRNRTSVVRALQLRFATGGNRPKFAKENVHGENSVCDVDIVLWSCEFIRRS